MRRMGGQLVDEGGWHGQPIESKPFRTKGKGKRRGYHHQKDTTTCAPNKKKKKSNSSAMQFEGEIASELKEILALA